MNTYTNLKDSFLHPVPTVSLSLLSIRSFREVILDVFKVSLFALNQSSILESSKFAKSCKSCKLLEESCSVISSAKRIVKDFDALGRSLELKLEIKLVLISTLLIHHKRFL